MNKKILLVGLMLVFGLSLSGLIGCGAQAPKDVVDEAVSKYTFYSYMPDARLQYHVSYTITNRFVKRVGNEDFDCLAVKINSVYDKKEAKYSDFPYPPLKIAAVRRGNVWYHTPYWP